MLYPGHLHLIIRKHWFSLLHIDIGYNVTDACYINVLYQRPDKNKYPYTKIVTSSAQI